MQEKRKHVYTKLVGKLFWVTIHNFQNHKQPKSVNEQTECGTSTQWNTTQQTKGMNYWWWNNIDEAQMNYSKQKETDKRLQSVSFRFCDI